MIGVREWEIEPGKALKVKAPAGARFLGCGTRGGTVRVWCLGNVEGNGDNPRGEERTLVMLPSNTALDESRAPGALRYVGSAIVGAKAESWHVFEIVPRLIVPG